MPDSSDRLQALHADLNRIVHSVFTKVAPAESHHMRGWQVKLQNPPPEDSWKGTFDRTHLQVFAKEGKSSLTIHVWHPGHPHLLREHEESLVAAGWKVMVGCLRWTRKTDPPLEPIRRVLESVRE